MRMTLHPSFALTIYPFIHLAALWRKKGIYQSRLFLKRAIDKPLLHAGWIVLLVDVFQYMSYEISNRLLGLIVAAIATMPWLYLVAKDI